MGTWILPKNTQMVQGFPVNRSYTKAETDALIAAGGGGSMTEESPTSGAVNGSNTTFVFAHTPKMIVTDRMTSVNGQGYTFSGTEPTVTVEIDPLLPPVQFIRSFY